MLGLHLHLQLLRTLLQLIIENIWYCYFIQFYKTNKSLNKTTILQYLPLPSAMLGAAIKRPQSFSNVQWLFNSRRWRCHMQQGARNMVLPTPVVSEEGNVANSSSASNRLHLQHTRPHTQTCGCVRHSRTEDYICHPHLLQEFIMKLLLGGCCILPLSLIILEGPYGSTSTTGSCFWLQLTFNLTSSEYFGLLI